MSPPLSKINELLKRAQAKRLEEQEKQNTVVPESNPEPITPKSIRILDKYGNPIVLNEKQAAFVQLAGIEGKSAVLIGAAGTGKTTTQRAVCEALIQSGHAGVISTDGHKHLSMGSPGIVVCAYTRRAVANIRRNLPNDLQNNALTIHKLLEFEPVYETVTDEESGKEKTRMMFKPARTAENPLPASIHTIIIEEGSMLGVDLYRLLINACPHNPQIIYLGDIQQLPPVFGPAILGFKLLELPVIELTEVYRQALESPIISLAHRILSGNPLPAKEFPTWKKPGQLTIHPWKKKIDATNALQTTALFFVGNQHAHDIDEDKKTGGALAHGIYDPDEDIILIPFNKAFGTEELNKFIANAIAKKYSRTVYQVIGGFIRYHFSVGERVLYDKEDAVIVDIQENPAYSGAAPQVESPTLDYWGFDSDRSKGRHLSDDQVDFMLQQVTKDKEDKVRQASHKIKLKLTGSDVEITVDKASEIANLDLGYAITVHKSQGSEWRKVFFVCHQSHATMLQRELLYTAVTRAREELYVICEPETFEKGILSQRVKGNTLEEKAEFFKGKLEKDFML